MVIARGKIHVDLQSGRFRVRSLDIADATPRWGEWLNDPHASLMLNARPRRLEPAELQAYIKNFDQIDNLLLGVFTKDTGQLIGFGTVEIVDGGHKIIPTVLIGEPEFRNFGVLSELRDVVAVHFFEVLGFEGAMASVLEHNTIIIHALEARGWTLKQRLAKHKKSATGEGFHDLLIFEIAREKWRHYARQQGLIK